MSEEFANRIIFTMNIVAITLIGFMSVGMWGFLIEPSDSEFFQREPPPRQVGQITQGVIEDGEARYEGEMLDGEPNGWGIFTNADGDVYEGGFLNGIPHGKGKITFSNGSMYDGEFRDGEMYGRGIQVTESGDVIEVLDGNYVRQLPSDWIEQEKRNE